VPLYLVYPADGSDPVVLPQLLTPALIAKELASAGATKSAQQTGQQPGKDLPT
jgi:thiol:disulfide interchange protein DsbD